MSGCRLPPNVEGTVHGHLRLHVPFIMWTCYHQTLKDNVKIEVEFWGQRQSRTLTPFLSGAGRQSLDTLLEYDISCSLEKFQRYLTDMGSLELVVTCDGTPVGSSQVTSLHTLNAQTPIAGLYPIICLNGFGQLGELFLSLSLWGCHNTNNQKTNINTSPTYNKSYFEDICEKNVPYCSCGAQSSVNNKPCQVGGCDCHRHQNSFYRNQKYQMNCGLPLPCRNCHHCPSVSQRNEGEKERSAFIQEALAKLLERAVKLRDKGLTNVTSQRSYCQSQPQVRLEDLVESIFREDSSPEESLLETLFFPTTKSINTHSGHSMSSNKNSQKTILDIQRLITDQKHSSNDQTIRDIHLDQPVTLSAKNSLQEEISKATLNQFLPESNQHKLETLKKQRKNRTVSNRKKIGCCSKSSYFFSDNWSNEYLHIGRTGKDFKGVNRDLRVTLATVHLTDGGLKILSTISRDWIFYVEMKVHVLKGFGRSIWNNRGHRLNSDLKVLQFISCLYKDGVVTFNQEKLLMNVDKERTAEIRLEVKGSLAHQVHCRRHLGSCILSLKDLCDAQVILPVITVQPNAQLSLKVSSVDASSLSRHRLLSQVTQTNDVSITPHSLEDKRLFKEPSSTNTSLKGSQDSCHVNIPAPSSSSVIAPLNRAVDVTFRAETGCRGSVLNTGAVVDSAIPRLEAERSIVKPFQEWILYVEEALNLPEGISHTYFSCCVDGSQEVKSHVSPDCSWNFYQDVTLNLAEIKKLQFQLWKTDTEDVTYKSRRNATLIGTANVSLESLSYLSCLSGWYGLYEQGKAVGQLKVSIWPKEASGTRKVSKLRQEEVPSVQERNSWRNETANLDNLLEQQKCPETIKKLPVNEFIKKSLQRLKS